MAASNRPKLRPAKINLAETTPLVPLNEVMEVKSAGEEKSKIEIKKELLKPVEPAKIEEKPLKVIETNLIKGEIITFIDWHKKIVVLINVVLIPIFLIAVIYIGLMSYQKQSQAKIQEQTKKFNELTEKIKQAEVGLKDITEFQTRLGIVSKVFAKHIYWTNFFRFLEDNTIKDVYYSGFGGDTGGKYSLDAVASTFSNISEQVDILRNNHKITDVQTSGGQFIPGDGANKTKVKFTLDLSILKDIFTE